MYTNF